MLSDYSVYSTINQQEIKNESFSSKSDQQVQGKQKVFFLLSVFGVALLLACTPFFMNAGLSSVMQIVGSLGLGYLSKTLLQRSPYLPSQSEQLKVASLMAVGIIALLAAFSFLFQQAHLMTAVAAGCAFFLPYAIGMLWPLFNQVSETNIALWHYSDDLPVQKATVFLDSLPIRFTVQTGDFVASHISFKAPVRMKLGLIFFHVVQEQSKSGNSPIHLTDKNNTPYGWAFFTPGLIGWRNHLDPEKTLVENGVRPNSLIIATCIKEQKLIQTAGNDANTSNKTV